MPVAATFTFGPAGVYTAAWDGVSVLTVTLTSGGAVLAVLAPVTSLAAVQTAVNGFAAVVTPLTVAQGGTGATSATAARTALGAAAVPVVNVYAPGSLQTLSVSSVTFAAFSTGLVCTGNFTASPSGAAKITVSCVMEVLTGATGMSLAVAAGGTVTPLLNPTYIAFQDSAVGQPRPYVFEFDLPPATLTPGTVYNLDVLGAIGSASDSITILALGNNVNPIVAATRGGPVIVTTQVL